jgi:hypothetical protein
MSKVNIAPLVKTMERWIPSTDAHVLLYPELVIEEIKATILKGRWWSWLPAWAYPLRGFRDEVSKIAIICNVDKENLTRRILNICSSLEIYLGFDSLDYNSLPIESWWVAQSIDSWIFYDLRPTLHQIIFQEIDGIVN